MLRVNSVRAWVCVWPMAFGRGPREVCAELRALQRRPVFVFPLTVEASDGWVLPANGSGAFSNVP